MRVSHVIEEAGRVEYDVDGEPLWFSSSDISLNPSGTAIASALLIAAAGRGEPLEIDIPVDRVWLSQVPAIGRKLKEWWNIENASVVAPITSVHESKLSKSTAQCFTGGVDSFYSLITTSPAPDYLVMVHGYALEFHDEQKFARFSSGFAETAHAFGCHPIVVRTNLRRHSAFKGISWERSHGGALAAVGHLISHKISELLIPSSYPYHDPKPWGSHWELDHFWSSATLLVRHGDARLRRNGKVRAIAENPLANKYVRVCWDRNDSNMNCSRCEKCVRTMIAFAICKKLSQCSSFDQSVPLPKRVRDLSIIEPHLISIYEELRREIKDAELGSAVDCLIAESKSAPSFISTLSKKLRMR